MKILYPQAIEDQLLRKYFPENCDKSKPLDRQYFFNVLNTVYPEYVASVISHASKQRNEPGQDEEKKNYILIADEWYNKLMQHPFLSSKLLFREITNFRNTWQNCLVAEGKYQNL